MPPGFAAGQPRARSRHNGPFSCRRGRCRARAGSPACDHGRRQVSDHGTAGQAGFGRTPGARSGGAGSTPRIFSRPAISRTLRTVPRARTTVKIRPHIWAWWYAVSRARIPAESRNSRWPRSACTAETPWRPTASARTLQSSSNPSVSNSPESATMQRSPIWLTVWPQLTSMTSPPRSGRHSAGVPGVRGRTGPACWIDGGDLPDGCRICVLGELSSLGELSLPDERLKPVLDEQRTKHCPRNAGTAGRRHRSAGTFG